MLSILCINCSRRHFEIFFWFSQNTGFDFYWEVPPSSGDNLHEMSNPIFWENKKNINLLSAEFAHKDVTVKCKVTKEPCDESRTFRTAHMG